jgi:hypothetical protein
MVEFIVTVPAGTGGGYYIDSVQKPIVPVVTGGTFRFNQNDSTNNNHPLILSTTTSTAGIISTGVSYYLDGASNQTNYLNTTLFNAATVRYIEITVAQTSDFYYICNVHGSGMGNVMDITTNTWSALSWNLGLWGEQNNVILPLTGFELNTSQGQANYTPGDGWGRFDWGALGWGVNFANNSALLTGFQLNLSEANVIATGEINEGWGRLTWSENAWGGTGDVIVEGLQLNTLLNSVDFSITAEVPVTGQQLNTSLNSVTAFGLAIVSVTGQQLNISEGEVDIAPDANVTGQQLNLSVGTVQAYNVEGWGRETWGEDVWGAEGTWVSVAVIGQQINTSLNSVTPLANANIDVTGQELNIAEGEVDPSPDATVTGIGMTIDLSLGTVIIGTAEVSVTGEQLNISLGTAVGEAVTLVSITGIGLKIEEGTVFAGGNSIIDVTGNELTIALNSINNQIWTEISTGTDATWIEIDTAA